MSASSEPNMTAYAGYDSIALTPQGGISACEIHLKSLHYISGRGAVCRGCDAELSLVGNVRITTELALAGEWERSD